MDAAWETLSVTSEAGRNEIANRIEAEFATFVGSASFPCLAGKGAVHRGDHTLRVYDGLGTEQAAAALARDLGEFVRAAPADGAGMRAFVAVFRGPVPADEIAFERRLWQQLQRLHEHDDPMAGWDPGVSADPESAEFSFSFGGHALFVV